MALSRLVFELCQFTLCIKHDHNIKIQFLVGEWRKLVMQMWVGEAGQRARPGAYMTMHRYLRDGELSYLLVVCWLAVMAGCSWDMVGQYASRERGRPTDRWLGCAHLPFPATILAVVAVSCHSSQPHRRSRDQRSRDLTAGRSLKRSDDVDSRHLCALRRMPSARFLSTSGAATSQRLFPCQIISSTMGRRPVLTYQLVLKINQLSRQALKPPAFRCHT